MVILVTVPIFLFAQFRYTGDATLAHVDDSVNALVAAADTVSATGPGTVKQVWVTLPGSITSTEIAGRHIDIKVNVAGQETDIHGLSNANLTGTLPSSAGTYRMQVEALDSGLVSITQ